MSIEQALAENTAAIKSLEATIKASGLGGGGAKASSGGGSGAKAADKPAAKAKPKHTADQVKTKIMEVKDSIAFDRAKEVIEEANPGGDLADLLTKPELFDNAYSLAEAALEDAGGGDNGNDGL